MSVKTDPDSIVPVPKSADLREKQSQRATFQLSPEFVQTIGVLSAQMGIKQKSLLDFLLEDTESLRSIALKAGAKRIRKNGRIQKTFVVSRKSLTSLNEVTSGSSLSRDDLVEHSVQRLLPILKEERQKLKRRKEAVAKIATHLQKADQLLSFIEHELGKDDPIFESLESVFNDYRKVFNDFEKLVDTGERVAQLRIENL